MYKAITTLPCATVSGVPVLEKMLTQIIARHNGTYDSDSDGTIQTKLGTIVSIKMVGHFTEKADVNAYRLDVKAWQPASRVDIAVEKPRSQLEDIDEALAERDLGMVP
jgi:hypothetical protein